MPTTITVDLDTITPESAKKFAGILLAFAGYEDEDTPEINPAQVFGPANPAAVFSVVQPTIPAIPAPPTPAGIVSTAGPHLVIPAPPVQASPIAAVPPAPGALELDSKGLPWDARIHASTKARNKDNSWKMKRGVADVTVTQIESELRHLMAIPSPQHALIAAQPPMAASSVKTTVASPAAVIPSPPPAPIQVTAQMQSDYVAFIGTTSIAIQTGKLTEQELLQCLASVGISSLPLLGTRLDLLPSLAGVVNGIIAGRSV